MAKDYDIGYGKPPKHSQFQKGQSGNAKGRPKGTCNLETDLSEELAEQITIREGGRQRKISKQRAMIKSLMAKAVKGDVQAANKVLQLVERLIVEEDPSAAQDAPLNADESKILDRFIAQRGAAPEEGGDDEHDQ